MTSPQAGLRRPAPFGLTAGSVRGPMLGSVLGLVVALQGAMPAQAQLRVRAPVPEAALPTAAPLPYSEAVAARFPPPAVRYDVPALQDGREGFTTNAEVAGILRRLAARPAGPRLLLAGRSHEGVAIEALHFSRDGAVEPGLSGGAGPLAGPRAPGRPGDASRPGPAGDAAAEGARLPLRPRVLLVGQQHGDEPAGAEALLVLAERLAPGGDLAPLLDHLEVVLLPRANPDGAVLAQRVGRHGSDINRDHLLLRTPEARAVAMLVRAFDPVVVVDAHEHTVVGRYLEKFGAVQRNDLLLQYATTANLPRALTRASEEWFRQPLVAALAREGLSSEWYYTNALAPGDLRLAMGGVQPDTARNVLGLRNAISILLETRGVGIGRLHLARRVHTHVVALTAILQQAAARADALLALRAQAAAEVAGSACRGEAVVLAAQTPTSREVVMLDPETGADKPVRVEWLSSLELRPLKVRARPCGYWIAAEAGEAVQRLRALGLRVRDLDEPVRLDAETWIELTLVEATRPDVLGRVSEPQTARLVQVALARRPLAAAAGSWYVPMDQPLANLALAALEPDSPNSFFANRLLPSLDSAARVRVPPGR